MTTEYSCGPKVDKIKDINLRLRYTEEKHNVHKNNKKFEIIFSVIFVVKRKIIKSSLFSCILFVFHFSHKNLGICIYIFYFVKNM